MLDCRDPNVSTDDLPRRYHHQTMGVLGLFARLLLRVVNLLCAIMSTTTWIIPLRLLILVYVFTLKASRLQFFTHIYVF